MKRLAREGVQIVRTGLRREQFRYILDGPCMQGCVSLVAPGLPADKGL